MLYINTTWAVCISNLPLVLWFTERGSAWTSFKRPNMAFAYCTWFLRCRTARTVVMHDYTSFIANPLSMHIPFERARRRTIFLFSAFLFCFQHIDQSPQPTTESPKHCNSEGASSNVQSYRYATRFQLNVRSKWWRWVILFSIHIDVIRCNGGWMFIALAHVTNMLQSHRTRINNTCTCVFIDTAGKNASKYTHFVADNLRYLCNRLLTVRLIRDIKAKWFHIKTRRHQFTPFKGLNNTATPFRSSETGYLIWWLEVVHIHVCRYKCWMVAPQPFLLNSVSLSLSLHDWNIFPHFPTFAATQTHAQQTGARPFIAHVISCVRRASVYTVKHIVYASAHRWRPSGRASCKSANMRNDDMERHGKLCERDRIATDVHSRTYFRDEHIFQYGGLVAIVVVPFGEQWTNNILNSVYAHAFP